MSLQELETAKNQFDQSRSFLATNVKEAIRVEAERLFNAHLGLYNIQFAQKSSEYNDEGMYPGVFGPVANREDEDDYYPAWLDNYSDRDVPSPYDESLVDLRRILSAAGDEVLSEVFGDSARVIITRHPEGGVKSTVEWVGY